MITTTMRNTVSDKTHGFPSLKYYRAFLLANARNSKQKYYPKAKKKTFPLQPHENMLFTWIDCITGHMHFILTILVSLKGDFLLKIVLEIWGTLTTGAPHKDQHY